MTEAELGALMLASARAEKHRPGLLSFTRSFILRRIFRGLNHAS